MKNITRNLKEVLISHKEDVIDLLLLGVAFAIFMLLHLMGVNFDLSNLY